MRLYPIIQFLFEHRNLGHNTKRPRCVQRKNTGNDEGERVRVQFDWQHVLDWLPHMGRNKNRCPHPSHVPTPSPASKTNIKKNGTITHRYHPKRLVREALKSANRTALPRVQQNLIMASGPSNTDPPPVQLVSVHHSCYCNCFLES